MALSWNYTVTLIDEQGLKTSLSFDMGTTPGADIGIEGGDQMADAQAIRDALVVITTANVFSHRLSFTNDALEDATLPAEAEVPEEAAVAVHLAAAPDPEKLAYIRVPAPVDALFLADGQTVDTNNVDLQAYVAALPEISDGEPIVTARGSGGIKKGHLRFRARSTR